MASHEPGFESVGAYLGHVRPSSTDSLTSYTKLRQMVVVLHTEWRQLPQQEIGRLTGGMRRRVNAVIQLHDCSVLQPYPPHCAEIDCTTSSNKWCVKCTDSLYYKLIGHNCIDKCSSRNGWCWPGSCKYDVAANCNCMTGFKTVKNKFTANCQPIRKPITDHFQITAVAGNDENSSSNSGSADFSLQKNFYGRFQVDHFKINVIAVFQIHVSTISKISRPNFISRELFGITDVDISMKKITISGHQKDLGTTRYKTDSLSKYPQPIHKNDNATIVVRKSLKNGERSEPLILSRRLSPFRNITVQFKGWIDPNINTGSGIESYEIAVYEVKRISPMIQIRDNKVIHILKVYPANNRTSINMELPLKTPMLYTVLLTVKDKANNTRRARRFVLYDNSSVIMLSPNHSFSITEVMNHIKSSQLCISWENRFYNNKFKFNNFLHPIRPETAPTSVEGIYDQERKKESEKTEKFSHDETRPTALRTDEEYVELIIDHAHQRLTNPFDVKSHLKSLINISTGMHASKKIGFLYDKCI
ncbi:unnamed protein product [Mytilus coruscus]|uniref:Uncharacterized protein n=1 Tax=Mytilus coruscus TaxID=42192 RepID=A0A6J8C4Q9_MYTCO|nr:unnamed protein product [Mytilus coruscus]